MLNRTHSGKRPYLILVLAAILCMGGSFSVYAQPTDVPTDTPPGAPVQTAQQDFEAQAESMGDSPQSGTEQQDKIHESSQQAPAASASPSSSQSQSQPVTPTAPAQTGGPRLSPARMVVQAMMRILVQRGIFPEHVYELYKDGQNPVVDRAHFTDVIIKAIGHDTRIVSEFPVYRDVDKTHWAYAPIEVARERKLIQGNRQGYFYPDAPITRRDAYLTVVRTLAGAAPTLDLANSILSPFSDVQEVPESIRPQIARLVNANIILPRPAPYNRLDITRPMRYGELAAILTREIEIKDYRRLLLPVDQKTLPQIPGGIQLSVVPNGAIYKNHLAVGDPMYFSLTDPVEVQVDGKQRTLPRGSRLSGTLAAIRNQFYMLGFTGLQTPEGVNYKISAELILEFNQKVAEPFIVPGTPYTTTTIP